MLVITLGCKRSHKITYPVAILPYRITEIPGAWDCPEIPLAHARRGALVRSECTSASVARRSVLLTRTSECYDLLGVGVLQSSSPVRMEYE